MWMEKFRNYTNLGVVKTDKNTHSDIKWYGI